jgi:Holliday junction resolvase
VTSKASAKGAKAERELVRLLNNLGLDVERSYGAGRPDDRGDLDGLDGVVAQVKDYRDIARAVNEALAEANDQALREKAWLAVGFVRRPRGRWIAVLDLEGFAALYREATA